MGRGRGGWGKRTSRARGRTFATLRPRLYFQSSTVTPRYQLPIPTALPTSAVAPTTAPVTPMPPRRPACVLSPRCVRPTKRAPILGRPRPCITVFTWRDPGVFLHTSTTRTNTHTHTRTHTMVSRVHTATNLGHGETTPTAPGTYTVGTRARIPTRIPDSISMRGIVQPLG